MGNTTLTREASRGVWIAPWLEGLWQDVRYAARGLRASPSFTLPALGVLIITMALTTGLYATVESVMLRPWPVYDPHRVVAVKASRLIRNSPRHDVGMVEYQYLREHAQSIDPFASTVFRSVRIGQADDTESIAVRYAEINPPASYTEADREHLSRAIIAASARLGLPRVAGSFGAPYAGGTHWGTELRAPDGTVRDATGVPCWSSCWQRRRPRSRYRRGARCGSTRQ